MPAAPPLPEPLPEPPEVPLSPLNRLSAQIAGSAPLSHETQSALILDLRRSLTDPTTAGDARVLLAQLRQRRDLLAWMAEDIDEALGTTPQTLTTQLTAVQQERDALRQHEVALQTQVENLQRQVAKLQAQLRTYESHATSLNTTSNPLDLYQNSIGMTFVLIPQGSFQIGSNDGADNEKPVHVVAIRQSFYLGQCQVTQAQWEAIIGSNPSQSKGDDLPVTHVFWHDVQTFIEKLNAREETSIYRLPTEAEWEYAARAGTTTTYSFGDDPAQLAQYVWYSGNSYNRIHTVGQLIANPCGLYDMHGNVWEWVQDCWHDDYRGAPADGSAWHTEAYLLRVVRGGSFRNPPGDLRSAFRGCYVPELRFANLGFRCVRVPQP